MAEKVGVEPTTYRLTADCSTTELHLHISTVRGGDRKQTPKGSRGLEPRNFQQVKVSTR